MARGTKPLILWESTPETIEQPESGDVHLWRVALADLRLDEESLAASLTRTERDRADRFAFPHLTRRWLGGRLALRQLLAAYLGTKAHEISFGSGVRGKPFVTDGTGTRLDLEFNMSDAGDYVIIGVTKDRALGVDIEAIRDIDEADDIVERNFSILERAAYQRLLPHQRKLAFFHAWTRKEAYTKAVGLGLYLPLDSFSVTFEPEVPARLLEVDGSREKASEWTLQEISAPSGHVGAFVVQGRVETVHAWTWRDR